MESVTQEQLRKGKSWRPITNRDGVDGKECCNCRVWVPLPMYCMGGYIGITSTGKEVRLDHRCKSCKRNPPNTRTTQPQTESTERHIYPETECVSDSLAIMRYGEASISFAQDMSMVCLTDMHRAVGSPSNKEPAQWQRSKQGSEYLASLCRKLDVEILHIVFARRGDASGNGTWAVQLAGLEYARWLSPDFSIECNRFILSHMGKPFQHETVSPPQPEATATMDAYQFYCQHRNSFKAIERLQEAIDEAETEEERAQRDIEEIRRTLELHESEARSARQRRNDLERRIRENLSTPGVGFYYIAVAPLNEDGTAHINHGTAGQLVRRRKQHLSSYSKYTFAVEAPAIDEHYCERKFKDLWSLWGEPQPGHIDQFDRVPYMLVCFVRDAIQSLGRAISNPDCLRIMRDAQTFMHAHGGK